MSSMMIIHTGDLHLGCSLSRESPLARFYIDVLKELVEKAIREKAIVLISGDFFDHYDVSYSLMIEVARYLRQLRDNNIEVVVVPGNHDNARSGRGVLDLFNEAGLIKLTRYEEIGGHLLLYPLRINDYDFYGVPGFRNQAESKYIKENRVKFVKKNNENNVIILAHVSVEFAGFRPRDYNRQYGMIDVVENELWRIMPSGIKYVALGHIHIPIPQERKFKSNIAYPGAPIGMNIEDLRETALLERKGVRRRFLMVDLEGDLPLVEAVELESSPKIMYEKASYISIDELRKHISSIVKDGADYHGFIFEAKVEGLKDEQVNELRSFIQEIQRSYNKLVYLRLPEVSGVENVFAGYDIHQVDTGSLSIEEIEEKILNEYAGKLGLRIPIEKIKEILRLLYEEKGERGRYYYKELYEKIKSILQESYKGG
ncbi:DNA double-strand break repair protein mre11 [Desulfurococcus amylolyticus 1221n]|uniref:DNA double-strand break repair protein mre11 n=2 Tax=Desulfurococcus TaxID=2273 RepID=B8D4A8_DESA1|nr:metallophosphoesterase [Desulfurococcus amylolyticus]ACL10939.1 DNA double-strand break repair protein mre11 [Desulfurococcus amylolyticus 1221n]